MPSYQFDNSTGRLRESRNLQPLFPISSARLERSETPVMMWDTVKTKPVETSNVRTASSGGLPPKMLKTMELMQRDLEYPVYKIKGTPDKILFGISTLMMGVGVVMAFSFLLRRTSPPGAQ